MQSSFLQSAQWQEFQEKVGRQTFRIEDQLFIRMTLPFGRSYLYSPRCNFKFEGENPDEVGLSPSTRASAKPIPLRGTSARCFPFPKKILEGIDKIKVKRDIFVRVEPNAGSWQLAAGNWQLAIRLHGSPSTQPRTTLILDLTKTDDQLLAAMKAKTRYNIRLAERKGIAIQQPTANSQQPTFDCFCQLLTETARRDRFSLHPKSYYQTMLEVLGRKNLAHLVLAYHQKDLLAGMILITYDDQAIYLHGASAGYKRNLMAPYLLHWQAIKFARSQGCKSYDFWGINQKIENRNQKIARDGITRFKLGFGGQIIEYPGCFELPLRKMEYDGYRIARKIDHLFKPRTFQ